MSQEQNKKTLRHFQCRDYLWEIFEQMSAELECSTDYLINEAMRQYARSRSFGARPSGAQKVAGAQPTAPQAAPAAQPKAAPQAAAAAPRTEGSAAGARPVPPPPRPSIQAPRPAGSTTGSYPQASTAQPSASASGAYPVAPSGRPSAPGAPPPLPGGPRPGAQPHTAALGMPPLFVIFNGERTLVNKEEFVIGRGAKTADLAIKDGNISRRHAAVVFQGGAFYMKDLGSTNGVEHQGRRVDSRRIEEGDVYQICDYEIRFTYR